MPEAAAVAGRRTAGHPRPPAGPPAPPSPRRAAVPVRASGAALVLVAAEAAVAVAMGSRNVPISRRPVSTPLPEGSAAVAGQDQEARRMTLPSPPGPPRHEPGLVAAAAGHRSTCPMIGQLVHWDDRTIENIENIY